jgi:DNA-binding XRE family transcriptional regulator
VATVHTWTGLDSRRLRHALRLTVRDFAQVLGVSPRTVSKWEAAGVDRRPRPELQAALDTLLARATDSERLRFADVHSGNGVPDRGSPPGSWPLLGWAGMLAGPPRATLDQLKTLVEVMGDLNARDEQDLAGYLDGRLTECQVLDGSSGPGRVIPTALALIAAIESAGRRVGVHGRFQLVRLAARAAEFAGWLYRDAGAPDQALYWHDRAMDWAQQATDPAMQGYILLRKSQAAWDDRDGQRVLMLARAAQSGPVPDRVRAEAIQQEARGLAMTGVRPAAVEDTLRRAAELRSAAESAGSAPDYPVHVLQAQSALCFQALGDGRRAVALLEEALASHAFSRRDSGYFTAMLARANVTAGQPVVAARAARAALELAIGTGSARTVREVERVAQDIVARPGNASTGELVEALRG